MKPTLDSFAHKVVVLHAEKWFCLQQMLSRLISNFKNANINIQIVSIKKHPFLFSSISARKMIKFAQKFQ